MLSQIARGSVFPLGPLLQGEGFGLPDTIPPAVSQHRGRIAPDAAPPTNNLLAHRSPKSCCLKLICAGPPYWMR